jgi:hypothetical protein
MKIELSTYLNTRKYNKKLYVKIMEPIEKKLTKECIDIPGLIIRLSMSAKSQEPVVIIKEVVTNGVGRDEDIIPIRISAIEFAVTEAIDECGCEYMSSEDKGDYFAIYFNDVC